MTMDTYEFLARHAVIRLSAWRNPEKPDGPSRRRQACFDHLRAVRQLQVELRTQESTIAGEAIFHKIPFSTIGRALSIEKSSAHKAYATVSAEAPRISCLAAEWRSGPPGTSVARNAIRQGVNVTRIDLPEKADPAPREWVGILVFLKSARSLRAAIDQTERDIVAELRSLGVPWKTIAGVLDSKTTATQKRFRGGLPERRLTALAHEAEAITALQEGHGDPEDYDAMTVGRAMRFALHKFKSVRSSTLDYVDRLLDRPRSGVTARSNSDANSLWQAETAERISQAVLPVLIPGVCNLAVEAMLEFERLAEGDGVEYATFTLYLFFLFALSFSYVANLYRITFALGESTRGLTAEEAQTCMEAAVAGAGVAKIAVEIAEALLIDELVQNIDRPR